MKAKNLKAFADAKFNESINVKNFFTLGLLYEMRKIYLLYFENLPLISNSKNKLVLRTFN